ncbi:precorrin-8X/cobalt-precorrin-8 methylmutase [Desulfitispora alkaliphila]|uniref:precorrin-8X methylmutase n=1 Tax=Desulfitispora alkaliphila TaxID=622674 RepID=UPI003D224594
MTVKQSFINDPKQIESKSMDIILELVGNIKGSPQEQAVIKRMVHTTGDPDYVKLVQIHPVACSAGMKAIESGCKIITDVKMVVAGINKKKLSQYGVELLCGIDDPEVVAEAKKTGQTRAFTAMKHFSNQIDGNIVAIGNAPTALFQLLELVDNGIKPSLIIGTPVGFVGAAESKELLTRYEIPYITVAGYKGGSTVAAATVNALLYQL